MTEGLYDLSGKTAVITGAAGLLGQQHASALLELGAHVVLTDIDEVPLNRISVELGEQFEPSRIDAKIMDVTDPLSVAELNSRIEAEGSVDILINNAAIDPKAESITGANTSRFEHFHLKVWNSEIAVGLTGAFLCAQAFGTSMAERGHGVILNIASDLSLIAPDQRLYLEEGRSAGDQPVKPVTYSVIKTGLVGLTRYLAAYWADKGVRVNALSPGGVYNNHPEGFVHRLTDLIPMGRMASVDEYHGAVQFLCSNASSYMTGHNLVVDGGRTVL